MKINKIISSALLAVMLFMAVVVLIPTKADAAYISTTESTAQLNAEQIEAYINSIYEFGGEKRYDFSTAEEMLIYERDVLKYLNSVTTADKQYTIYVNKYTGFLYYVNNNTGQIITSNPHSYTDTDDVLTNQRLLSQITLEFSEVAGSNSSRFNSTLEAGLRGQISSQFIRDGIRVNYTLGDTSARFLLPGRMKAAKFEELVLVPMLENFGELMNEYCGEIDYSQSTEAVQELYSLYSEKGFDFFEYDFYYEYDKRKVVLTYKNEYETYSYGYLNSFAYESYFDQMRTLFEYDVKKNPAGLNKNSTDPVEKARYKELDDLASDFIQITRWIQLKNPSKFFDKENYESNGDYLEMIENYYTPNDSNKGCEIFKTLEAMYVYSRANEPSLLRETSLLFQEYVVGYTFSEMYEDEQECGYVNKSVNKPVFRLSLEYCFNSDGSLNVRLPANSISFDETIYHLDNIMPLEFFGVGNINNDGYIFYPDGSGTILNFKDLGSMKIAANQASEVYGRDQCYSNIEIISPPHAQISMPVYGVVSEVDSNFYTYDKFGIDTVTNGYLAILEEGASLAQIGFQTGGASHPFGGAYCFYEPYPSDQYDLSETLSVGAASKYTIVSDSKYTGSYVTRIVMLTDEKLNSANKYYDASYMGMASYYRDYLEDNGVLKAIENANDNLPLYIEALGSMEIITKILSFPVTQKIALTTFDDILTMYNEISDKEKVLGSFDEMIAKYEVLAKNAQTMAEEMEDATLASKYMSQKEAYDKVVAKYKDLKAYAEEIDCVNFRLTGFGNGGLYYTYPTKVRWDKACGGKAAFNKLVSEAEKLAESGKTLGIYPDYDFMYINYTELFDGISNRGNVSRMVDNRYASKQVYDSIMHEYISNFTLVINPEALDKLYSIFIKQYSKYPIKSLSVSTLGSDLNSNFDEEMPINRDDAENLVTDVLGRIKDAEYDVMLDVGNIYSIEYANHIINASIDSSHFRFASSPVPFVGMVLHGYVNYSGSAFNYSGAPAYDMLRYIESGAAPYYILCYQNSEYLKEDSVLNDYYGVDYSTWYQDMVLTYTELNHAIGDLQDYKIVDHKFIIGERIIEEEEIAANNKLLEREFIENLTAHIELCIHNAYAEMVSAGLPYATPLSLTIDEDALLLGFAIDKLHVNDVKALDEAFVKEVKALCLGYETEYSTDKTDKYSVTIDSFDYDTKYKFRTTSLATDKEYVYTDFTSDSGNIVLITYSNGTDEVQFILNYNIFTVEINLGGGKTYELGKYEYVRIG